MKTIIDPVDRKLLLAELNEQQFLRPSNKGGNLIYDITAQNSPNVMREIGRLREVSFRMGGGGTGEEIDIDRFDTDEPYHQIVVWDPDNQQIVGGYRYVLGCDAHRLPDGQPDIVSTHMFDFRPECMQHYFPHMMELGRAFVQPEYQTAHMGVKSLFSLDNLWDGIGAVLVDNPQIDYLMGKVTIYPQYDALARDLIYAYLERFCPDSEHLIITRHPYAIRPEALSLAAATFEGDDKEENFKRLQQAVRKLGTRIPALFTAYIQLAHHMRCFGTGVNDEFGDIYDTGIMIAVSEMVDEKRNRYLSPYRQFKILRESNRQHKSIFRR